MKKFSLIGLSLAVLLVTGCGGAGNTGAVKSSVEENATQVALKTRTVQEQKEVIEELEYVKAEFNLEDYRALTTLLLKQNYYLESELSDIKTAEQIWFGFNYEVPKGYVQTQGKYSSFVDIDYTGYVYHDSQMFYSSGVINELTVYTNKYADYAYDYMVKIYVPDTKSCSEFEVSSLNKNSFGYGYDPEYNEYTLSYEDIKIENVRDCSFTIWLEKYPEYEGPQ